MNCREAQPQIFAERDGALDTVQRAALEGHLATCDACRRTRADFTAALTAWRVEVHTVVVPDAEREWHAVRRRIRGGAETGAERVLRPRRNLFTWIAVPLGAAAAVAVALFVSPQTGSTVHPAVQSGSHVARVNSVDVPGNNATTMIFVDDKSGWLFVCASDAAPKRG
jgi:anti-sigma factor RsiW